MANNSNCSEYCKIEMNDCNANITFTAEQPVINKTTILQSEAKLTYKHNNKIATLAKASFSVININKLAQLSEKYPGLSDLVDMDSFFHDILYFDKVEVMYGFHGFGYEQCLVQRIIDNYGRNEDPVIIKLHPTQLKNNQNTNTKSEQDEKENDPHQTIDIWKEMRFERMKSSSYCWRNPQLRQPKLKEFCKCYQQSTEKQQIKITQMGNILDDDAKDENTDSKSVDIDINLCFVTISSEQNATNDILEEDYTSLWNAKLIYKPVIGDIIVLASGNFWLINIIRLCKEGYDDISTVFEAPCQQLCDLFCSVMNSDLWFCDGPFKLHKDDRINNFKVRTPKELLATMTMELENADYDMDEFIRSNYISDEMNEGGGGNIIYLDRIKVNEVYNGFGYGRCLVQKIIDNHARGFDSVVLKPFPLQWEKKEMKTEESKKLFEKDMKKVIQVWESMWFYPFGGNSGYWGRSEAWTHPKIEEFCKCLQPTNMVDNNNEKITGNKRKNNDNNDETDKQPPTKKQRIK
eukprot:152975_1